MYLKSQIVVMYCRQLALTGVAKRKQVAVAVKREQELLWRREWGKENQVCMRTCMHTYVCCQESNAIARNRMCMYACITAYMSCYVMSRTVIMLHRYMNAYIHKSISCD